VTEQEGLAVIFSLKKFRHYLLGYKAKIVTDHKALTYLVNKPNPSGRLARWLLLMEEYLDGMRFPDGATKAVRTRIAHKSRNYSMIGNQLYFQGRDGVLRRTIGKRDTSRLLYEFHDGFCGSHFVG
jgi:hypothetical protein